WVWVHPCVDMAMRIGSWWPLAVSGWVWVHPCVDMAMRIGSWWPLAVSEVLLCIPALIWL
ncbi:MAG: hypothetical protein J6I41_07060, partial [Bacteroidales bacterium]|nr:hypothetical protein [Bacteroidales bacterium]